MKIEITGEGVTHKMKTLAVGAVIDLDEESCKSLIAAELAKPVVNVQKAPVNDYTPQEDKLPDGTGEGQPGGQQENVGGSNEYTGKQISEEEIAKLKKVLNDQYKRDELYEAAIKVGVNIAYDARKADIIDAIVEQEKTKALLG